VLSAGSGRVTADIAEVLRVAESIAHTKRSISYPSGVAAQHVRDVMRDLLELQRWQTADAAPKDGSHILVCRGPYGTHWGFNQSPPMVVHWWGNPGEEGFYLSGGIVQDSYNDAPVEFTHWRPLIGTEPRDDAPRRS
jgi:hypothetical protein